jgi:hypothetical protein
VSDAEDDAEFATEFEQEAEESDRVGAAGNGRAEAVAGANQVALADVCQHLLGQRAGHGRMLHAREMQNAKFKMQNCPAALRRPTLAM